MGLFKISGLIKGYGLEHMVTTKLEAVYNILKENIVNGNLKPGDRLIIRKIAQELGVSEIPVREAIRSLEAQGLVTMIPHAGAHVSMLDKNNIKEIIETRSILEGYAASSAIPLSKTTAAEFRACIEEMRECVQSDDFVRFGALNARFHRMLCEQTDNTRIQKIISSLIGEYERTRAVFALSKERLKKSFKEHEAILAAMLAEDREKTERLVREHRMNAGAALLATLENNGRQKRSASGKY